jgi:hypothetical protein
MSRLAAGAFQAMALWNKATVPWRFGRATSTAKRGLPSLVTASDMHSIEKYSTAHEPAAQP